MIASKFNPVFNQVYFINQYTLFHILEGTGGVQVDFKNYFDLQDRLIFLEKGQYIKFLKEGFLVRRIEFQDEKKFRDKDVRVLFKHLISLGYIEFKDCRDCQRYLDDHLNGNTSNFFDISSQQWYWQNPFNATKDEYHIIFDVKDVVDEVYRNTLTNDDIASLIGDYDINPHALYRDKVGITIRGMLSAKRLTESQKELAFTDKRIKEIAYEFGFRDSAYFTRVFKAHTGMAPAAFQEGMAADRKDSFVQELMALIQQFHSAERSTDFYADQMNMSVKTLAHKVRTKLQTSINQLIREEILQSARKFLTEQMPVHEVAGRLGFQEANHFSAFFKNYTSLTPTQFQHQKVQEIG